MEPYPHTLTEIARQLRRDATEAEQALWERLRDRQLSGLKIRRQHRIGKYIVDFYCAAARLVIELEGSIHDTPEQKEYDKVRFEELRSRGLKILRFRNAEVLNNMESVLNQILNVASVAPEFPSPNLGEGAGG